ncbi:MAG: hypothetical protein WCK24_00720 [Actinomycetes bacterium]
MIAKILARVSALPNKFWFVLAIGLVAQLILIWLGTASGDPLGDVRYTYDAWVSNMIQGHYLLGLTDPWVYPFVAQLPLWLAHWIYPPDYLTGWLLLVVNLNMLLIAYMLGWGKRMDRVRGVWFFILCVFLCGPVAIGRLEVFSLVLTIFATISFLEKRESTSMQLFNAATWIKVSPMAALFSGFIVSENRKRFVIHMLIGTAAILGIGLLLGGNMNMFSFVGMQSGRGIQVESTIGIFWLIQILLGISGSKIYYDNEILTFQISGFGVTEVASIMTVVQFGALAITIFLGFRAVKAGVDRNTAFAWIFLTATLDLLVFNKVGSPQYELWVVGAAIVGILAKTANWRLVNWLTIFTSGLSWLIFPVFYGDLLDGNPLGVSLLTLRNVGVIAILVYANIQLTKLGSKRVKA